MRHPIRVRAGAVLLATLMLAGAARAEEPQDKASIESVRQQLQDLNQELSEFTAERRKQLMEDIENTLKSIDARIETLETRIQEDWEEMDEIARAHARATLGALRRERARVAEWYERMEDSSEFTWESMKDGFNDAFDKLSEAWQDAEQDVQEALKEE